MALIGREPPAEIVVRAPEVSARHAELTHLRDDQYQLADLGSTNGTYVNGQRIQTAVVTPADHIELGSCPFDLAAWLHMIPRADAGRGPAPSYAPPPPAASYAPPALYAPPPAPAPYAPPPPASFSPPPAPYSPAAAPYSPPPPPYMPAPSATGPYPPAGDATYGGAPPPYESYGGPSAGYAPAPPSASTLPGFLFVPGVLRAIEGGGTFRTVFALILRISAGLAVLGGLGLSVTLWMAASSMEAKGIAGLLLFQVLLVVGIYAIVHTVLIRASDIAHLPESEFVVIPIFTIYLRLTGETLAWSFVTFGFGGGLLGLFMEVPAGALGGMPGLPGLSFGNAGGSTPAALMAMLSGIVMAFGALLVFYLLAEMVSVTVAIARNTEAIRKQGEQAGKGLAAGV